jgi:RNA polymerase sigma-70 factor (ECF subfamily)
VGVPAAGGATVEQWSARRDDARKLLDQALTLPPEYREPLLLRCVRALSYQQISDILELPVTTIETRLARARRMLREEIGDHLETEGIM